MPIYDISDAAEFRDASLEAERDNLIVLIFYDSASKDALAVVEKLSGTSAFEEISFFRNDLGETQELAEHYHVKHAPTCLLMKAGKVVDRVDGPAINDRELHDKIYQNN